MPTMTPRHHATRAIAILVALATPAVARAETPPIVTHRLAARGDAASYDEAMAAATLQGIINRDSPRLYMLSNAQSRPAYWLDVLRRPGGWLEGRGVAEPVNLDALVGLARGRVRGAVVWDPAVPATVNVATTIAGVEDAVVLSPELAEARLKAWGLPILHDLRGRFDGHETGSKKNDAYRWAVREYLDKGRCSSHRLFLNEDAATRRAAGGLGDVVTRDWAVKNRAYVFDLSPWGDEVPADDPGQRLGLDLESYRMILESVARSAAGRELTELAGFFSFAKYAAVPGHASRHDPVYTEWETVRLISPHGCYQNTVTGDSLNQSFHSQAPRRPLAQKRPLLRRGPGDTTYIAMFMADYDSAFPLYDFLPAKWDSPDRGKLPLAWGINPNLLETYPDLIDHFYATASPNDLFTADASAAGYFNPNLLPATSLPLFVEHNRRFFREADMTIAPMVLDWDEPTAAVKDAFREFAPDGFATIVMDLYNRGGKPPKPHLWKGMPVTELISEPWDFTNSGSAADLIHGRIARRPPGEPAFLLYRVVWMSPTDVVRAFDALKAKYPEDRFELVDIQSYFSLFREDQKRRAR